VISEEAVRELEAELARLFGTPVEAQEVDEDSVTWTRAPDTSAAWVATPESD